MSGLAQSSLATATWRIRPPVLVPDGSTWWLGHYAGASAATIAPDGRLAVLVSGRDRTNRSHIGWVRIDLDAPERPPEIDPDPVFAPGGLGCFDDSGVSYPCLVDTGDDCALLYTGWMQRVSTPFQNQLGLAVASPSGRFVRASRAPIMPFDADDHLSIGSVFALVEDDLWRLWYTSFTEWGSESGGPPHRYAIKYATSADGRVWSRDNITCIGPANPDEHSICRPSVIRRAVDGDDSYHMWFCSRGDRYQIQYARSTDGVTWDRAPGPVEFSGSTAGFDDRERAYPHVIEHEGRLLMTYSGNGYGKGGLGIAELSLAEHAGGNPAP